MSQAQKAVSVLKSSSGLTWEKSCECCESHLPMAVLGPHTPPRLWPPPTLNKIGELVEKPESRELVVRGL